MISVKYANLLFGLLTANRVETIMFFFASFDSTSFVGEYFAFLRKQIIKISLKMKMKMNPWRVMTVPVKNMMSTFRPTLEKPIGTSMIIFINKNGQHERGMTRWPDLVQVWKKAG